jgi:hypothetical protein
VLLQYVFAFCALMVHLKMFKKVKINFMIVGHTHDDVDGLFGVISKHLNYAELATIGDLLRVFKQADSRVFEVAHIQTAVDVKDWMKDWHGSFGHISKHLQFRFKIPENTTRVVLQEKTYSWEKEYGEGVYPLHAGVPTLLSCPTLLAFRQVPELKEIEDAIPHFVKYLSNPNTQAWWDNYINNFYVHAVCDPSALWLLPSVMAKVETASTVPAEVDGKYIMFLNLCKYNRIICLCMLN